MSPHWYPQPELQLNDLLDEAMAEIGNEIKDDPSFELVSGITMDRLANHATAALAALLDSKAKRQQLEEIFTDPSILLEIYTFGFVIGTRFGENRAESRHQHNQSPEQKE